MASSLKQRVDALSADEAMRLHENMRCIRDERLAKELRELDPEARKFRFAEMDLDDATRERLRVRWDDVWARPDQLAPDGDWRTWLAQAGRGWGKTEAGAQWVRQRIRDGARNIAIIAETQKDLEEVMIARLLHIYPEWEKPRVRYKPVRVIWPNGALALGYNGTEPDQLRGPEFDTAWVDELAKYALARETWDMLQFTMRRGEDPRVLVTTTPRPIPIIKEIRSNRKTVIVTGSTLDNAANLSPDFIDEIMQKYEGTRLGRQEIYAEILDDFPGALWTREMIEETRIDEDELPDMQRMVIAVDPSGTKGEAEEQANDVGIVVVGVGVDGRGYVIADLTCNLSPDGWARRVVQAFHDYEADRVVAETNFGGAMVEAIIKSVDPRIPFSEVKASRGKVQRAEPVAALYEQGRVSHVGMLTKLEDQMMMLTGAGYEGDGSPDRVDAAVWGITDLMLNSTPIYSTAPLEFQTAPFKVPDFWPKGFAMKVEPTVTSVLWGAYDKHQDILYVTTEHVSVNKEASIIAAAIKSRGIWIPGIIDSEETNLEARREMAAAYEAFELKVMLADRAYGAGVQEVAQRIATGRLKVSGACQRFFREYRAHRRDDDGNVIGKGLMDCIRILARPSTLLAMKSQPKTFTPASYGYGRPQPSHVGDRKMGY